MVADGLADLAADRHQLPGQALADIRSNLELQVAVVHRLLAISHSFLQDQSSREQQQRLRQQQKAEERVQAEQSSVCSGPIGTELSPLQLLRQSSHRMRVQAPGRWRCTVCLESAGQQGLGAFLARPCTGRQQLQQSSQPASSSRSRGCRGSRGQAGAPHPTHPVQWVQDALVCTKCGNWTKGALRKLGEPCCGGPTNAAGEKVLRQLAAGRLNARTVQLLESTGLEVGDLV